MECAAEGDGIRVQHRHPGVHRHADLDEAVRVGGRKRGIDPKMWPKPGTVRPGWQEQDIVSERGALPRSTDQLVTGAELVIDGGIFGWGRAARDLAGASLTGRGLELYCVCKVRV